MKDNKKSIWKRIAAIVASAFLVFSQGASQTEVKHLVDPDILQMTSEMNADDSKKFYSLANHYADFKDTAEDVISLEDMFSTQVNGEICDTMVPQGLAELDDMLLVTAYDGIDGYKGELTLHSYRKDYREKLAAEKNHETHNSVILVIDKATKKIVTTLELPDKNHVGGIAIDGQNAYIAKSLDGNVSVISLGKLKRAINVSKETGLKAAKIHYDYNLACHCDASFVSLREKDNGENQLVVGTWNPIPAYSTIRIFDFENSHTLSLNQKFNTNTSANGACFIRRDGKEYMLVASSMGRTLDSRVFVYEVDEGKDGVLNFKKKSEMKFPPMLEEIAEVEGEDGRRQIAIGSEAFTKRYEIGKRKIISNGIIITDLDKVLDREQKPKNPDIFIFQDAIPEEEIDGKLRKEDDDEKER